MRRFLPVALALAATLAAGRTGYAAAAPTANKADAGAPLLVLPSGGAPTPPAPTEAPGTPPPRALDSARSPMPDREALPKSLQATPLAPPTPPVPDANKKGGGANRVNDIRRRIPKRGIGGAPPDLPRDSVTRTPEDQLAPFTPTTTP